MRGIGDWRWGVGDWDNDSCSLRSRNLIKSNFTHNPHYYKVLRNKLPPLLISDYRYSCAESSVNAAAACCERWLTRKVELDVFYTTTIETTCAAIVRRSRSFERMWDKNTMPRSRGNSIADKGLRGCESNIGYRQVRRQIGNNISCSLTTMRKIIIDDNIDLFILPFAWLLP